MSKVPEFVVTGLHMPGVHFWARVLVSPDRLSQVKESVLRYGTVHLQRDERLEIETRCGDEQGLAVSVCAIAHFESRSEGSERGRCLVAWNDIAGAINIFGDHVDDLAAMHGPLIDALVHRDRVAVGQAWLDADKINAIQVGNVTVFFDRDVARDERAPENDRAAEEEPDEWLLSRMRISELQCAINAERLRIHRLGVRPRRSP